MKVFALLTACLMTAGGATYYISSSEDGCPFGRCPVAKTGGCCSAETAAKPDCCQLPCPACSTDCAECCSVCEDCCAAGAGTAKAVPTAAKAKPDCCAAGEDCCLKGSACCGDKANSPAAVATSAVIAGAGRN